MGAAIFWTFPLFIMNLLFPISLFQVPDEPFLNTATIPEVDRSYESSPVAPPPPLFNSPPPGREENTSLIRKTKDEIMEESVKLILFAPNWTIHRAVHPIAGNFLLESRTSRSTFIVSLTPQCWCFRDCRCWKSEEFLRKSCWRPLKIRSNRSPKKSRSELN